MPSTRDIRRRIKSVKNTKQITKAMELVAASKMKKAQNTALAGNPYSLLLSEMLAALEQQVENLRHPFLETREIKTRGILLITTDKGLCGGLNANLFKMVTTAVDRDAKFVCIGRKGTQFLGRTRRNLLADFSVSEKVEFNEVKVVSEFFTKQYLDREIDSLEIVYPKFVNTLRQDPVLYPLLPLSNLRRIVEEMRKQQATAEGVEIAEVIARDERPMIFEPSARDVLSNLLPLYINQQIYQFVLDAKASEHSARMVAMKTASDNATNLLDDLTLEYNKARQAAITQEILEIAAATASN